MIVYYLKNNQRGTTDGFAGSEPLHWILNERKYYRVKKIG